MNLEPLNQKKLFGHNEEFNKLISLYKKNRLPNKILFSGEKGIGKSTIAYHLINYILSLDEDNSYDLKNFEINSENKSFKLTHNKSNPNFYLIDVIEERKKIDINQIRNLINNLNKSSFNLKPRFVLIDNIDFLNVSSINALLKILEEPNHNINFILINNNKRVLSTLKSRCLNFKISLSYDQSIDVTNKILKENIFDLLDKEFISNYSTPGQLIKLINFANEVEIDLKKKSLKEFLSTFIKNKYFKKNSLNKNLIFYLIEFYFRINISSKNIKLLNFYNYFLKKIDNTYKFNLDEESLFMEFDDIVLNG